MHHQTRRFAVQSPVFTCFSPCVVAFERPGDFGLWTPPAGCPKQGGGDPPPRRKHVRPSRSVHAGERCVLLVHGERPRAACHSRGGGVARAVTGLGRSRRAPRAGHPTGSDLPPPPRGATGALGHPPLGLRSRLRSLVAPAAGGVPSAPHPRHGARDGPARGHDRLRHRPSAVGVHPRRRPDGRGRSPADEAAPFPHRRDRGDAAHSRPVRHRLRCTAAGRGP